MEDMTKKMKSEKFISFIKCLWLSVSLSIIGCIIACFDVKSYYCSGRLGEILQSLLFIFMEVWLAFAVSKRKNWARWIYVFFALIGVLPVISNPSVIFDNSSFENISALLIVYCAFQLCFNKEVRQQFADDKHITGAESQVNVLCCVLYVVSLVGIIGFSVVWDVIYQNTQIEYIIDMFEAAKAGSKDARQDWIDFLMREDSLSAEEATSFVDKEILECRQKNGKHVNDDGDVVQIRKNTLKYQVKLDAETQAKLSKILEEQTKISKQLKDHPELSKKIAMLIVMGLIGAVTFVWRIIRFAWSALRKDEGAQSAETI